MKNPERLTRVQIATLTKHLKRKHRMDALYFIKRIEAEANTQELSFIGDIQVSEQERIWLLSPY